MSQSQSSSDKDKDKDQHSSSSDESGGGLITTTEFDRVTTEDYAMDSFQNLLFSIARFKE